MIFIIIFNLISVTSVLMKFSLSLSAGEPCRVSSTNALGICTLAQNCPQAFQQAGRPDLCSFAGKDAIICCPNWFASRGTDEGGNNGNANRQPQQGSSSAAQGGSSRGDTVRISQRSE